MKQFGKQLPIDLKDVKAQELNAYKKLQALRSRRPPYFWLVGPERLDYAFKVQYCEQDNLVSFHEIPTYELSYSKTRLSSYSA